MIKNDLVTPSPSHISMPTSPVSPHIFIVEKNPGIAEMITWMLELAGYPSIRSVREMPALSQIPLADYPMLILFDIDFLRESSSKLLTDVRTQYISIGITPPPIIVLTTNPAKQKDIETMGYHAVLKPFRMQNLTQMVHEILILSSS